MQKETLWERIKKKFEDSIFGVLILGILVVAPVVYYWYSNFKTEQSNNRNDKINKELLLNSKSLIDYLATDSSKLDSVTILLDRYLIIRNSITGEVQPDVKIQEGDLKNLLFKITFEGIKTIKSSKNDEVISLTIKKLKPFCNQIIDFCQRTNTCSEAHLKTLNITIDELNKNY